MTDKSTLFGLALAMLSFAIVAGCSPDNGDQKAQVAASNVTLTDAQKRNIHLYTVEPLQFHKTVETSGIVDFDNDQATSVVAPISGPVSRLLVNPGQHVERGQPLALVASPDYATAIGSYRASIVAAAAARKLANMDKDLLAHQGVAEREADQAEADAATAEANRATALQTLTSLNVDQNTIRDIQRGKPVSNYGGIIRAPLSGTVVERLITPGQLLQAGTTPAFTIANLSRVWVMAQVFDSNVDSISLGDSAQVMTGAGSKSIDGEVTNISAQIDPDTRSVAVRVAVDNSAGLLKKQMYVRVLIEAKQESSGLLIPVSAVLRDDENLPFVYVAQRDGSFARAHVTLGYRTGDRYDVAAGVQSGQQVVADGGLFIQFMQSQ